MARAIWRDTVVAEAEEYEVVEGNVYFPPEAVKSEYLRESDTKTRCPWKGVASYYDLVVDGEVNSDAAWCYPEPSDAAGQIEDHVAFWNGVEVEE